MSITPVTSDVAQSLHMLLNLATKGAFDDITAVDHLGDLRYIFVGEFLRQPIGIQALGLSA